MSNTISNSGKRKLLILVKAAGQFGCLVNRRHCFALMSEPAVKSLIENKQVRLVREGNRTSKASRLIITPKGEDLRKELTKKLGKRKVMNSMGYIWLT